MFSQSEILTEHINGKTPNCMFFIDRVTADGFPEYYRITVYPFDKKFYKCSSFRYRARRDCFVMNIRLHDDAGTVHIFTANITDYRNYSDYQAIRASYKCERTDKSAELLCGKYGNRGNLYIDMAKFDPAYACDWKTAGYDRYFECTLDI